MRVTRRQFGLMTGGTVAAFVAGAACRRGEAFQNSDGRLSARPRTGVKTSVEGTQPLGLGQDRDAILQVPAGVTTPLPLLILLHGASGNGQGILRRLSAALTGVPIAVLSPDSRIGTWDAIRDGFGRDVAFIDRALKRVFETVSIDHERIAVGGFSDGATYALSLGLINGDLFTQLVAFSPGFVVNGPPQGKPKIFISHGTADPILPIDQCSRMIVPALRRRGYEVTFREFEGRHEVPADIARDGINFCLSS